jgi:hypothetical protein
LYRWIGGIAIAVILACVGVGCGGGGGSDGPEISKAEFVKKADFICAEYKSQRLAVAEKEFNPKQRQAIANGSKAFKEFQAELPVIGEKLLQEKTIPLMRTQHEELEALGAPDGEEEQVEQMLDNMEKATDETEEMGFPKALVGNQFDEFEKEAEEFGLSCKVI